MKELGHLIEDMQNDRKPYPAALREARAALERKLTDRYGRTVKVQILADLFHVKDDVWKNAVEGRMGRLKRSLVTEPKYARDAAALFREMKKYEEVELIDTDALVKANAAADENSLYEAVFTDTPYVDACLRRYLGRIQKCDSVEALEQVSDGVTPDCYSYSNYSFRHLRRALFPRKTGMGDKITISLHHAAVYALSTGLISAQYGNQYPKNRREVPNPFNNVYRTKDGKWLVFMLSGITTATTKKSSLCSVVPI